MNHQLLNILNHIYNLYAGATEMLLQNSIYDLI